MRNYTSVALMLSAMLALAGCATTDAVLFVTKTSLGIDFDAKPASASIAYDRTEGYIAPRYDNGEIPPVVASIKSDGSIFNPKIRQVYATGDAAVIAVSKCPEVTLAALDPKDPPDTMDGDINGCPKVTPPTRYTQKKLKGDKKLMFFGTTTTTGLKVGFTSYVPDSFVFGFKRKEYSFIPVGKQVDTDGTTYDVYPSVLASIDTAANAGRADEEGAPDTSLSNAQFFATGRAARELAANPAISDVFKAQAVMSLRAEEIQQQNESDIDKILKQAFDQGGKFKQEEFNGLVDKTTVLDSRKDALKSEVKSSTTVAELREILNKTAYRTVVKEMATME